MAMTWKESETEKKNKNKKTTELKPFSIKHYDFYPCSYTKSKKEGFIYFLRVRNRKGIVKTEIDSPRFKSRKDAESFVESNKDYSFVIG